MGASSEYTRFPRLETQRLVLRELQPSDVQAIFGIGSDDEVMHFYDLDTFQLPEDASAFIGRQRARYERESGIRWGIVRKEGEEVIGWCGYVVGSYRRAELGYALARDAWGQGLMTEAVRAVVGFAFETTQINRLEATTHLGNGASARVLEKLGFVPEGLLREFGYWRGQFHDLRMHSLLRKDYLSARGPFHCY
jgi:ribosomal-protein-alanine N-acetyltransferase